MAAKSINLLPKDLAKKDDSKLIKSFKNISYVFIAIFFLINVAGFAFNYIFNNQLTSLKQNQNTLRNNITSLEETETRLILTKDRIIRIGEILRSREVEKTLNLHTMLIENLPSNVFLKGQNISSSDSVLELDSTNSRDLVGFMSGLLNRTDYTSISLQKMSFSPITGYNLVLEIF